ncbi:hypothetical protein BOW53_15015 [Solemya pervernicosa gill symbiont]|uniref:Chemotaxis protein n=3 Tax=Gammaproteobacteria incertae sedis TaxID=118884 RepID=A0A1T2L0N6_9GAMM|nr:methyl-accepting chemotaxis protein [Solemya pervernicosa gill symbiont]OOZ38570.1 hypothetical protein BOW53_15015 [Solemya pervernicosa gill symbiont]
MKFLNNLSIRLKILIMLVAPVIGLLYFSIISVMDKSDVVAEMESVEPLAQLAVKVSALVHETQKERGATAGFLGSKGTKFVTELPAQRNNTDQKRNELNQFLKAFNKGAYGGGFENGLNDVLNRLGQIDSIRSSVSAQTIKGGDAIGYYTGINGQFLNLIGEMTALSDNGVISRNIAAYVNFLLGKERAGIERAVLAGTFAADAFGPGAHAKFSRLVTEQDTYANVFLSLATDEAKQSYKEAMGDSSVAEVVRMRKVANANAQSGGFGIDSVFWFKTQTAKINQLKKVEDWLSESLIEQVGELRGQASTAQMFYLILAIVAVGMALLLSVLMSRNITGALGQALNALEDIAQGEGDLTSRLDATGRDEIAQLAGAFNLFVEKIESIVSQIRQMSESIQTATGEIAAGNTDLSARTEEQASSLEETASSMEEMTSTVKQNADNARQANQLAASARDQASEGGEVVGSAVNAMAEINTSSRKIADIISVIDEIAFQTNLLALNAAVEAARAGEQGRGFAVVAGEVRTLAQRSAEAAKEIKNLIEDSVSKVDQGSALVDQSGKTLEEIVTSVKKVTDIVSEIAAASSEQASGIDQINNAITQMDDVTQQNAALVEEAAAASKSMEDEAHGLASLVGQFKVSESFVQEAPVAPRERTVQRSRPAARPAPSRKPAARAPQAAESDDEWEEF